MQEWQEKTKVGDFLLMSGCLLHPDAEYEPEKVKKRATKERSFTELRFASFPSPLCCAERSVKVEMNALRATLTALSAPLEQCRHFLLDRADAFIDGPLYPSSGHLESSASIGGWRSRHLSLEGLRAS